MLLGSQTTRVGLCAIPFRFARGNTKLLSEQVSDFKKIGLESKIPSNGQYNFNCHDEYSIHVSYPFDGIEHSGVKVEHSYGDVCWDIDLNSSYDIEMVLSVIKGNCWDCNAGGNIEVCKPKMIPTYLFEKTPKSSYRDIQLRKQLSRFFRD